MDCLEHKLDVVAADLSTHRKDTEAHGMIYKVKEQDVLRWKRSSPSTGKSRQQIAITLWLDKLTIKT